MGVEVCVWVSDFKYKCSKPFPILEQSISTSYLTFIWEEMKQKNRV